MEGGWILDGQKRWIGNGTFADVLVVFARNTSTNQINGYVKHKYQIQLLMSGTLVEMTAIYDVIIVFRHT